MRDLSRNWENVFLAQKPFDIHLVGSKCYLLVIEAEKILGLFVFWNVLVAALP